MDGLKQRVIGALVLISLAVIFVPMLFDEPHTERSSRMIDISEEPPFPEVQAPPKVDAQPPSYRLEEPPVEPAPATAPGPEKPRSVPAEPAPTAEQPVAVEQQPEAKPAPEPEPEPEPKPEQAPANETADKAEPESGEFSRSLEGAWVVQLGSFGNADNARRLRDKVREKGYDSHLQRVEQGDTTFTRVFAGPFADKSAAEKAKRELDAGFGLNGLVTAND